MDSLTTYETLVITSPMILGYLAAFGLGLGAGLWLGGRYLRITHE